jgi:hypothetical protein
MSRFPVQSLGMLRRAASTPLHSIPPTPSARLAARLRTELTVAKKLPSLVHCKLLHLEQRALGAEPADLSAWRAKEGS